MHSPRLLQHITASGGWGVGAQHRSVCSHSSGGQRPESAHQLLGALIQKPCLPLDLFILGQAPFWSCVYVLATLSLQTFSSVCRDLLHVYLIHRHTRSPWTAQTKHFMARSLRLSHLPGLFLFPNKVACTDSVMFMGPFLGLRHCSYNPMTVNLRGRMTGSHEEG